MSFDTLVLGPPRPPLPLIVTKKLRDRSGEVPLLIDSDPSKPFRASGNGQLLHLVKERPGLIARIRDRQCTNVLASEGTELANGEDV